MQSDKAETVTPKADSPETKDPDAPVTHTLEIQDGQIGQKSEVN